MNDFYVPIEEKIKDFSKHIKANPRTIISSKFGDGKSFFLQKVKEDVDLKKEYEFITIYPVNYQVVGNRDIFELIKRDILFQLMLHNMISGDVVLKDSEAFSWFVYMNGKSLISDLLSYIAELGLEQEDCIKILAAMKGLKLFKSVKSKFEKFNNKQLQTDDSKIDAFMEKVDRNYVYECDVITQIIQKSIEDYQRRTHKKVLLIIEDMDRIDPAHLFRILNVLSAHIDYGYRYFVRPDTSLVGNKFNLDNIILVIDYNNLRHIYKHFYGERTDFNGYMSKFLSSVPFEYSLKKQKYEYIIKEISKLTDLNEKELSSIFPSEIVLSKTIREVVKSFEISNSIVGNPVVKYGGENIRLNTSILRVMAIYRRLKYSDEEIRRRFLSFKDSNQALFIKYILPYRFLSEKNQVINECFVTINNVDGKATLAQLFLNKTDGTSYIGTRFVRMGNETEDDFEQYINEMFNYIA